MNWPRASGRSRSSEAKEPMLQAVGTIKGL